MCCNSWCVKPLKWNGGFHCGCWWLNGPGPSQQQLQWWFLFMRFFQVCADCGVLYGRLSTMSIFTTIWNIDIRNSLTLWYLELNFELNAHGYIEWKGIDYCPVDGANSVSWYWMVYFGFVLAPPCLCSSVCVWWRLVSCCVTRVDDMCKWTS